MRCFSFLITMCCVPLCTPLKIAQYILKPIISLKTEKMLENLLQLVTQNAGDAITNNPQIPNEHNEAAVQDASSSIMDVLGSHLSSGGGGLAGVLSLLKGGGDLSSNPIVGQIIQQ